MTARATEVQLVGLARVVRTWEDLEAQARQDEAAAAAAYERVVRELDAAADEAQSGGWSQDSVRP